MTGYSPPFVNLADSLPFVNLADSLLFVNLAESLHMLDPDPVRFKAADNAESTTNTRNEHHHGLFSWYIKWLGECFTHINTDGEARSQ